MQHGSSIGVAEVLGKFFAGRTSLWESETIPQCDKKSIVKLVIQRHLSKEASLDVNRKQNVFP